MASVPGGAGAPLRVPAVQRAAESGQHVAVGFGHVGQTPADGRVRRPEVAPGAGQKHTEPAHPLEPKLEGRHREIGGDLVVHPPVSGPTHPLQHAPPLQHARFRADTGLAGVQIGGKLVEGERGVAQQEPGEDAAGRARQPLGLEKYPDLLDEPAAADTARMQEALRPMVSRSLDSFSPFRQY